MDDCDASVVLEAQFDTYRLLGETLEHDNSFKNDLLKELVMDKCISLRADILNLSKATRK